MNTLISCDGTTIAFERLGDGPPVILVGDCCDTLAQLLATRFTVYRYDRRGSGGSGSIEPYALAREVEDLESLLELAGGRAYVLALPSGADLAVAAAKALPGITRLALA